MMESALGDSGQSNRVNSNTVKKEASGEAQTARSAIGQEVTDLMADVQDLLGRVTHISDPDIVRMRVKVEGALSTAKAALVQGSDRVQRYAKDAGNAGDDYVRDQPWAAVGIASAAALVIGFLVARR